MTLNAIGMGESLARELMKNIWEERDYAYLGLSAKKLRDKAASTEEKRCGDVPESQESIVMANSVLMQEEETEINSEQVNYNNQLFNLCSRKAAQVCMEEQRQNQDHASSSLLRSFDLEERFDYDTNISQIQPNIPDFDVLLSEIKDKMWGNITHQSFCNEINNIYNKIVHFKLFITYLLAELGRIVLKS